MDLLRAVDIIVEAANHVVILLPYRYEEACEELDQYIRLIEYMDIVERTTALWTAAA